MKSPRAVLLVAFVVFIVFIVFSSLTYGFMRYLQKESVELAVFQEIERFEKDLSATNRLYFSFGLLAYNLFINDHANVEIIDKLLVEQAKSPILFIKSASEHFLAFRNTLSRLNINFIHLHAQNAKSFLRLGQIDGYGDNIKKTRPDVVYVQDAKVPLQSYELGRHGLLLRNIFPLNNFKEIRSIEFSSTLS